MSALREIYIVACDSAEALAPEIITEAFEAEATVVQTGEHVDRSDTLEALVAESVVQRDREVRQHLVEQALGKKRAAAFISGQIGFKELFNAKGDFLTLAQLQLADPSKMAEVSGALIGAEAPLWLIVVTALALNLRFVIFSAALAPGFRGVGTPMRCAMAKSSFCAVTYSRCPAVASATRSNTARSRSAASVRASDSIWLVWRTVSSSWQSPVRRLADGRPPSGVPW